METPQMTTGGALLLLAAATAVYLVPTWIAIARKHRNRLVLFLVNLCLGWTGLGWLGCLVWSLWRSAEDQVAERQARGGAYADLVGRGDRPRTGRPGPGGRASRRAF